MRTAYEQNGIRRSALRRAGGGIQGIAIRTLALVAVGSILAAEASAIDPSLCADDGVTEVPSFASQRDSNQCLRINPGNGDPEVLFQYEIFHEDGSSQCGPSKIDTIISRDYGRCRSKNPDTLAGPYCSKIVWDTVIDNYSDPSCKSDDVIHIPEGVPFEHYLMKNVQILNGWKCAGSGWSGPGGLRCESGETSGAHTDGIQLRGNPSGGGWFVMQDSEFLNGFHLHFLHQVDTKWGTNGSVMFQGVHFGRARKAGLANDYIQDCLDRGVTENTDICTKGFAQVGYEAKEYWLVDVYGTTEINFRNNGPGKIIIVNTGCGPTGCNGTIGFSERGWPWPVQGNLTPEGTFQRNACPNGPIGNCDQNAQCWCYTSLEAAAQDHKLPPFAHLSAVGWADPPGGALLRRPDAPNLE